MQGGGLSEMYSYTDFAMAGQDAYALVAFPAYFMGGNKLKSVNLQISAFPALKVIHIADAVAIKVRPHYVYLVGCLTTLVTTWFVGDHNLSCQFSQASISI